MASKRKGLNDARIKAQLDGLIADARSFDDSERRSRREYALAYQAGEMPDLAPEPGRSAVVEQILADTMAMLLPAIMRIFLASDRVAIFEPVPPAYAQGMSKEKFAAECQRVEDFAAQATDYTNFVFMRECGGEKLLRDAIYDGFLHANGIVKHWWDATPEYTTESYTNLTDDEYWELVSDPDVEVLEHSEKPDESAVGLSTLGGGNQAFAGALIPPSSGSGGTAGSVPGELGAVSGSPSAPAGIPGALAPGLLVPVGAQGQGAANGMQAPPPGPMADPTVDTGLGMQQPAGSPDMAGGFGAGSAEMAGPFASLAIGGNFGPPPLLHDVKLRRVNSTGRLRVKAVADEDFLIEANATALNEDECRFCAHLDTPTRSQLIERGFDKDIVWTLGAVTDDSTESVRRGQFYSGTEDYEDKAGERVQIYECYALLDPDEDGYADWFQIIVGGPAGSSEILEMQEWGGRLPFSDIVPDPVPHRWKGRSQYDLLRDPQRVATALSRRVNDNLYMVVEPQIAVDMRNVENPDAVFDRQLGSVIRTKGDPSAVIKDITTQFVGDSAMQMVQEQRHIAERRSGVGEQSAGLDVNALTNQVATAVTATQSASGARKEEYARNIAIGLRRVFSCMLRLMVENQDRPRLIRLRKTFVPMDPRAWSAEMDVNINVGLGAGNRDRDLAMLQGIAQKQELIIQALGPANPWVSLREVRETYVAMTEAAGVRGAERFFPEITDLMAQQMLQSANQSKPDPKVAAAQGQLQIAQQKAQSDAQLAQQKAQADVQLQQAKAQQAQQIAAAKAQAEAQLAQAEMQHRMEMDRAKAQQDLMTAQQKAEAEIRVQQAKHEMQLEMQRQKAAADLHLRTMELQFEAQLKIRQQAADINVQHTTDLELPQ